LREPGHTVLGFGRGGHEGSIGNCARGKRTVPCAPVRNSRKTNATETDHRRPKHGGISDVNC